MHSGRFAGLAGLALGVPAVVASVVLAGGGIATAAAGLGSVPRPAGQAGVISTVAGGPGGPGKGTTVALLDPCGVTFAGGRVYLADGGTVQALNADTDWLVPVAGAGVPSGGRPVKGIPAVSASLDTCDVAVDGDGNLVIADPHLNEVRVVAAQTGVFYGTTMQRGYIYDVAGDSYRGYSGDGGPAAAATLSFPEGVAVDGNGNLVIADSNNNVVRVVAASSGTFYGQAMTAGDIYTVAGDGTPGYAGDGGPAANAELDFPEAVSLDGSGNLVIADTDSSAIRVMAASNGTFYGQAMTAGNIYTVAGDGTEGYSGDGGPAASAEVDAPRGVAVDSQGNLLIADSGNDRIRVAAASTGTFYGQAMTAGDIYTVAGDGTPGLAGDGGPATSAELTAPTGVTADSAGNLVIAGSGEIRVVAASTGTFYAQAMTAGDIYTVASDATYGAPGDGGLATSAVLFGPHGVTLDSAGNLVISEFSGQIRVVAARSGRFYGYAMTAHHIYTIAGGGTSGLGDGGRATSAELDGPQQMTVDGAGNLVIADTFNERIRVVAASTGTFYERPMTAHHIYTVAGDGTAGYSGDGGPATSAELDNPSGVTVDGAGNLVIADWSSNRIRVVAASTGTFYGQAMTAGDIYTVAGDGTHGNAGDGAPATSAELDGAEQVAVDSTGNLVIADTFNNRIRVVAASTGTFYGQAMTAGDIYPIAGDGTPGYSGNGGPATSAELDQPNAVAVDGAGNPIVTDSGNSVIRVIAAHTGTFYGHAMTAGDIYTVAGDGRNGYQGDGGPGTKAKLDSPDGVAVDGTGNLVIADVGNDRIRMLTG